MYILITTDIPMAPYHTNTNKSKNLFKTVTYKNAFMAWQRATLNQFVLGICYQDLVLLCFTWYAKKLTQILKS
jgi:hypothetical protein